MHSSWYHWKDKDLILAIHLQPGAAQDALAGIHGDCLKIRITAPPIEGRANNHLIRFLAAQFGVPRNQVELLAGHGSRSKRVRIRRPGRLPDEFMGGGILSVDPGVPNANSRGDCT